MQGERFGNARTRSPPRAIRDWGQGYSSRRDVPERQSCFVPGLAPLEGREERSNGLVQRKDYDRRFDGDRDEKPSELSQFNEGLRQGDSPSMKFQWKHLLYESKLNANANISYGASMMGTERDYQGSQFSGLGRHEMAVSKSMSLEMERAITSSRCPLHVDPIKRSGRYTGQGAHYEELQIRDTLGKDGFSARELYTEQEDPMLYEQSSTHYMMPPIQSEIPGPYNDSLRTCELPTEPFGYDGHGQTPLFKPSTELESQGRDVMNYQQVQFCPTKGNPSDYSYPEVRRSERGYLNTKSEEIFGKIQSVCEEGYDQLSDYTYPVVRRSERRPVNTRSDELFGKMEDYGHRDTPKASIMDPISDRIDVTESSYEDHIRERKLSEHNHSLQEQPIHIYHDVSGPSYSLDQDGEFSNCRSTHSDFTPEVCREHGNMRGTEVYHNHSLQEQPIHIYSDVSGSSYILNEDGRFSGCRSTHIDFAPEVYRNLSGTEVYNDRERPQFAANFALKRDGDHDHERQHFAADFAFERDGDPRYYEEKLNRSPRSDPDPKSDSSSHGRLTLEELSTLDPSENMHKRKRGMAKKSSRHMPKSGLLSDWNTPHNIHDPSHENEQLTDKDTDSLLLSNRFDHLQYRRTAFGETLRNRVSDSGDLLSSCNLSVSMQRRLKRPHLSASEDVNKRLRPGSQNIMKPSSMKSKPYKLQKTRLDGFHGSLHAQGTYAPEAEVITTKVDPPEESEELMQLVHSAFLKFTKQLNESPEQRRKYKEQGKAGSLKCSICGSNSKEFVDTRSLGMHAFKSLRVGLRAQHLGFHKALCVLMGWKSAVAPYTSWVDQVLPHAEASAVTDDLIIWPPTVIIQNRSIGCNDFNERITVTIEMLETILRDMGFNGVKIKVCRGKPGNPSIMVVKFSGTFSGLEQAEKLHNLYAKMKQGRAELQEMSGEFKSNKLEGNRAESVLYGYLGIAGDMDKLDFESKKRSVVKSKKEIMAIVDATFTK